MFYSKKSYKKANSKRPHRNSSRGNHKPNKNKIRGGRTSGAVSI